MYAIENTQAEPIKTLRRDEPFTVDIDFVVNEFVPGLDVSIWLSDESGTIVLHDLYSEHVRELPEQPGLYRARVAVPAVLAARPYTLGAWLGTPHEHHFFREALTLNVAPRADDSQAMVELPRLIHPQVGWRLEHQTPDSSPPTDPSDSKATPDGSRSQQPDA